MATVNPTAPEAQTASGPRSEPPLSSTSLNASRTQLRKYPSSDATSDPNDRSSPHLRKSMITCLHSKKTQGHHSPTALPGKAAAWLRGRGFRRRTEGITRQPEACQGCHTPTFCVDFVAEVTLPSTARSTTSCCDDPHEAAT